MHQHFHQKIRKNNYNFFFLQSALLGHFLRYITPIPAAAIMSTQPHQDESNPKQSVLSNTIRFLRYLHHFQPYEALEWFDEVDGKIDCSLLNVQDSIWKITYASAIYYWSRLKSSHVSERTGHEYAKAVNPDVRAELLKRIQATGGISYESTTAFYVEKSPDKPESNAIGKVLCILDGDLKSLEMLMHAHPCIKSWSHPKSIGLYECPLSFLQSQWRNRFHHNFDRVASQLAMLTNDQAIQVVNRARPFVTTSVLHQTVQLRMVETFFVLVRRFAKEVSQELLMMAGNVVRELYDGTLENTEFERKLDLTGALIPKLISEILEMSVGNVVVFVTTDRRTQEQRLQGPATLHDDMTGCLISATKLKPKAEIQWVNYGRLSDGALAKARVVGHREHWEHWDHSPYMVGEIGPRGAPGVVGPSGPPAPGVVGPSGPPVAVSLIGKPGFRDSDRLIFEEILKEGKQTLNIYKTQVSTQLSTHLPNVLVSIVLEYAFLKF